VQSVASSSIVPGEGLATISGTSGGLFWTQKPEITTPATIYFFDAEPSFFSTYSIQFIAGEAFAAVDRREADRHVVINETARKLFGFSDAANAVGQEIAYRTNPGYKMRIHGVVKDFHIESSKEPVRPTLYYCSPPLNNGYLSVKVGLASLQSTVNKLGQIWKEVFPESHLEYFFMDERFMQQYKAESQLAYLVSVFTVLAIFIACMGLFGLATFSASRRTKEIGIRKVLGASVLSISSLLSKDFIKPVCIAVIIAMPVSGWLMNKWLQDFAFRISINWWVFAAAAFTALLIALLTISYQSIKAAKANPVKNLRTE
jgi:putative ABC transport system permease protein